MKFQSYIYSYILYIYVQYRTIILVDCCVNTLLLKNTRISLLVAFRFTVYSSRT